MFSTLNTLESKGKTMRDVLSAGKLRLGNLLQYLFSEAHEEHRCVCRMWVIKYVTSIFFNASQHEEEISTANRALPIPTIEVRNQSPLSVHTMIGYLLSDRQKLASLGRMHDNVYGFY